ncbi:MAG: DUF5606 domain-containing protein [Bacteroidales bacterium]|nr:DUF5606 domain-containing protein [Bacteroidales bacterium]
MEFNDIVAISGKSGLFRIVSNTRSGVIVESLTDGNRFPAFLHDRISSLDEISVFTLGEDRPLKEVIKAIRQKTNGGPAISTKSDNAQLKKFFAEAVPDYDTERVYVSDIKKIINWYNHLHEKGLLHLLDEAETDKNEAEAASADEKAE